MGIRSGEHIKLRGGVYHYRRGVPSDCRKAFGAWELTRTLNTPLKSEAKRLEKEIDIEFETRIAEIRAARDPHAVARTITAHIKMPVLGSARGIFGTTGLLHNSDLSNREQEVAVTLVDSYRASMTSQHIKLTEMVRELDAIFSKPVAPEVVSRFSSACVSLARSMVEGTTLPSPDPGTHTLAWSWERWVAAGKAGKHTKGSERQAERHWNSFLAYSELVLLSDVRRHHIVWWRDALIDSGEFAENSINQRLQLVTAILRGGWREAELLAPDLKQIKLTVGDTDRKPWSRTEILDALSVLRPHSWQAWLFIISLTTSVRLGEPVAAMREWWKPERGFIEIPKRATKKRKFHAIPILKLLRDPFSEYVKTRPAGGYLFDCPRPSDPDEPISNFASRSINRFLHDKKIERVFHELRDTWIDEARHTNDMKKEFWEIISGHSKATTSDLYGGEKPDVLMAANENICKFLTGDAEIKAAMLRLVA